MDATERGLQCGWAGCLEEFNAEPEWIKHVSIHVFTLKPNERTPWLGLPELDPDHQRVPAVNGVFFAGFHTTRYSIEILSSHCKQPVRPRG